MAKEIKSKEEFDKLLKEKKLVIADFWAEWCGPCQMFKPVFEKVSKEFSNEDSLALVKVNVDEVPDLSAEFSVMSIPTVIIFKNGEVFDQVVGVMQEADLKKVVFDNK